MEDPRTGFRLNVNRPTEIAGVTADEELESELAHMAYTKYLGLMAKLGGGHGPELYVEIHGNETQRHVEVGVVRLPAHAPGLIKAALEGMPSGALVEGHDEIVLDADQSRLSGYLRFVPHALHFELTAEARARECRIVTAQCVARGILAALLAMSQDHLA